MSSGPKPPYNMSPAMLQNGDTPIDLAQQKVEEGFKKLWHPQHSWAHANTATLVAHDSKCVLFMSQWW